jgi:hypothetical protein
MTGAQWTTCTNPHELLAYLGDQASERKLRLLACACARRIGPLLTDKRTRNAIEVAERFADGLADEKKLTRASEAATTAVKQVTIKTGELAGQAGMVGFWVTHRKAAVAAREVLGTVVHAKARVAKQVSSSPENSNVWTTACVAELDAQTTMVREVFRSPFHRVHVDPAWLAWKRGSVVRLAQRIYEDQMFVDLPRLAIALKSAGCDNAQILDHCGQAVEHFRGCWMLDLLLGKA